ncbi:Aste57867_12034 [Aphanomyces stellatus]|uniref:Aste57867_12034 protein n=1 Tax=Aphanomyces stellatus TaxID=120398 RepID=A0A485KUG8_9STRA|nr:hypothetical protein As57867_011989 [Aphanomyces stellatus]VFT88889.1 Aste57867_12034 [Aphanomyces stellatus]
MADRDAYDAESAVLAEKVQTRLKERVKEQHRGRTDAVLELKANTEKAFSELCGKNEKRNADAESLAESQAREFQELMAAGKNPYEVFRAREIAARAAKKLASQKKKIQEAEMGIASHMVQEAARNQKRDEAERRHAAYVQKYQKELGRKVVEDRTRDYMLSRTGAELVDPTGRTFRIDPSQVTVMKDHTFGLGKSSVKSRDQRDKVIIVVLLPSWHILEVIDMIAAKPAHAAVEINPRGLPKPKEKLVSNQVTEPEALLLPPIVDPPGKDLAHLHGVAAAAITTPRKSTTRLPSLVTAEGTTIKKGFGVPKRSKLEEAMRVRALAKQKENLIEKQIVWRKEFVGRAFLADPEVLWFKDFDVDRPMTLRVTLTNVSNTFNHFKLLPLPDDRRDFFEIKYDLPGRMSAGMTCHVHVTFCARLNQDIETELPAVAKTGYFSIPVKCTAKRAVPLLSTYSLTFANVVVGETSKQVVTLRNDGALPATFHVVRRVDAAVESTDERRRPLSGATTTGSELLPRTPTLQSSTASPPHAPDPPGFITETTTFHDPEPTPSTDAHPSQAATTEDSRQESGQHMSEASLLQYATSFGQFDHDSSVQTIFAATDGHVEPYATCSITFTFAPFRPLADLHETFEVVFDTPPHVAPLHLSIAAQAVQVPLYVENAIMDFKCCVYNKLYRNKLILRNRGKVAMKCQLKVPPYLADCLEFLPSFGFVQAGCLVSTTTDDDESTVAEPGRFEIQVKFRPLEKVWRKVRKLGFGWRDIIAIPLQVIVPDQILPVYFVLRAQLTSGDLVFSSPTLAFGSAYASQSVSQRLVLTNPSRLPQKFGFVHVPPELRVEPNDGFGTLLPLETTTMTIFYSPLSATEFRSTLTCATSMNRTYHIPCTGHGVTPALRFSESVVTMGAVPVGQSVVHSVVCANTTASPQKMEIAIPADAAKVLQVRPVVATIEPYSSILVEFEFRPTDIHVFEAAATTTDDDALSNVRFQASRETAVPGLHHAVLLEEDSKTSEYGWSYELPPEPKSFHGTFNLVCFVSGDESHALQSFRVHVSVIEPPLTSKPEKINFGQVAVGQTGVMKLHVVNNSPVDLDLQAPPLHCAGPFSVLNALRVVAANGGFRTLIVEFAPSTPLIFREELLLQTSRGNLCVTLAGEGVSPVLSITPADGKIDFKPVLAREKGTTEFSLLNSSQFPLKYIIKPLDVADAHPNFNQTNVFTCIPNEASIPPGETQVVRAVFNPDHERPMEYVTKFRVDVPNQTEDHVIVLRGRCWECQSYILLPEAASSSPAPLAEDVFDLPLHIPSPAPLVEFVKKAPRVLQVQFDTEAETKQVAIGSVGPQGDDGHQATAFSDGKASSPASFEVAFDAGTGISLVDKYRKYFTLEPMKGSVNPGQQTHIAIQFNPSGDDHESTGSSELRILHWIRVTAKVTIKGGYIPPVLGLPEQTIHLVLKARVLT